MLWKHCGSGLLQLYGNLPEENTRWMMPQCTDGMPRRSKKKLGPRQLIKSNLRSESKKRNYFLFFFILHVDCGILEAIKGEVAL